MRPKHVLVLAWEGGGNVPPAINLAARIARRGHAVRLMGWPSMAPRASAAGVRFVAYPSFVPWPEGATAEELWDDRIVPFLHGSVTRAEIVTEARRFGADTLVIDCMMVAGYDAARELALPFAALVHVLYAPFVRDWGAAVLERPVGEALAAAGAVLAVSPPGLDEPFALPPGTAYVGPITHPDPPAWPDGLANVRLREALREPGDPWVLASLSTTPQRQERALPGLLDALAQAPVRAVLTLGGGASVDGLPVPANVVVLPPLDHELLLPYMAAAVTHAGLGTVNAALAHGVPMLCVPQGREQPLNAARVVASGAGRMLPAEADPAVVAGTLASLLGDSRSRQAAEGFVAASRAHGHGELATRMVEALAPA